MSTKIYSGFKAKNIGIKQLTKDLFDIQRNAQQISKELTWNYQAFHAVLFFDEITLGLRDKSKYSCLGEARAKLLEAQQESERTKTRNPEVDYSFSICIYPVKNNEFMGVYFTEWDSKYVHLITSKPWYQAYGYWNNTDRPDNISQREWNKRERDWEIFRWGVPVNECMLTLECVKCVNFGDWMTKDSDVKLINFEQRVQIFSSRQLKNQKKEIGYFDFYKQLKDGVYAQEMDEIKQEIRHKLIKNLTLEMLLES